MNGNKIILIQIKKSKLKKIQLGPETLSESGGNTFFWGETELGAVRTLNAFFSQCNCTVPVPAVVGVSCRK